MRRLRFCLTGLCNLFRSSRFQEDTRREFEFHIRSRAGDLMRAGVAADEACRRARLEFGSTEAYAEQARDAWLARSIENLLRDFSYAYCDVRRHPGLVLTCVLSLGIGIGLNTAVFAALRAISQHQPTVSEPDRVAGSNSGTATSFLTPTF